MPRRGTVCMGTHTLAPSRCVAPPHSSTTPAPRRSTASRGGCRARNALVVLGKMGLEPLTLRLSSVYSNQLSYLPPQSRHGSTPWCIPRAHPSRLPAMGAVMTAGRACRGDVAHQPDSSIYKTWLHGDAVVLPAMGDAWATHGHRMYSI